MHSRDIRSGFLDYFKRQGHTIVPSSPLVPGDDPTLLFTNAGMNQFKDAFLGREKRAYTRATTSQKCMRVSGKHNDLDNVGPSLRHHTFFEMLGNFSFGDYFKKEAIPFAWELLTTTWKLAPERLFPTIFKGEAGIPRDAEAHAIWTKLVPSDRITELGLAENFWAMGETGPCGRCSEIHYFRGEQVPCEEEQRGRKCLGIDCSCDRFVEVWNNVFMEFDRQPDGTLTPLPAPSIDTGMGLERITAVIQGKIANYDTDLFTPILTAIGDKAGLRYGATLAEPADVSMRVIADHLRAMTFLIADGVVPSNEWRGYVLRKIMRRAMRHGKKLGFVDPVLYTFVDVLVAEMGDAYPELRAGRDNIVRVVRSEEDRFDAVLTAGLPRIEEVLDRAAAGSRVVPGEDAFRLYDSLGVPLDFMEDLASQRQLSIDREGFEQAMEGQREKARAGSSFKGAKDALSLTMDADLERALDGAGDRFEGYDQTTVQGTTIVGLFGESGASIDDARRRREGLHRAREHTVLSGVRRSGIGQRSHSWSRRIGRDGRAPDEAQPGSSALAPGARRVWRVPARSDRHRRGGRRDPRCDATQSHGDAPAPCGAATGPRPARQAGGLARGTRPSALRLRARRRRDARRAPAHRAHRQRADRAQHAGGHRDQVDRGSDCARCDGALWREVRRPRPRRLDSRLQHGALRRDARPSDW